MQKQPRHKSPFAASKHTPRRVFAVPLWLNRINWPIGPWNWVSTDAVRAPLSLLLDPGNFEINATGGQGERDRHNPDSMERALALGSTCAAEALTDCPNRESLGEMGGDR